VEIDPPCYPPPWGASHSYIRVGALVRAVSDTSRRGTRVNGSTSRRTRAVRQALGPARLAVGIGPTSPT